MEDEEFLQDDNDLEDDSLDSGDNVDYQRLLEEANQRTEKISQDYKKMHSEWQRLSSSIEKNNKILIENGIIDDIDERGNIIVKKKTEQEPIVNPFETIREEKKKLRRQYTNGDIDETEWNNKLDELTDKERDLLIREAEKKAIEKVSKVQEERQREQEFNASEIERSNKLLEVAKKYPDSENTSSKLFKEMNRLYSENKEDYTDRGLDPQTSAVIREKLIRDAYESLGESRPIVSNKFSGLKSSPYKEEDPNIAEVDKIVLNYNFDPSYKKDRALMSSMKQTLLEYQKKGVFQL
jgi:hypothetical protein